MITQRMSIRWRSSHAKIKPNIFQGQSLRFMDSYRPSRLYGELGIGSNSHRTNPLRHLVEPVLDAFPSGSVHLMFLGRTVELNPDSFL